MFIPLPPLVMSACCAHCCRWKARTNRLLDERIDPQAHQQALDGLASSRSELATRQEELTRSRAEVSQLNRQLTESRSEAAAAATQVHSAVCDDVSLLTLISTCYTVPLMMTS